MEEPTPKPGSGWMWVSSLSVEGKSHPITLYQRQGIRVTTTKSPTGLPIVGISSEVGESDLKLPNAEQIRTVLAAFGGADHWLPLAETPTCLYLGVPPNEY